MPNFDDDDVLLKWGITENGFLWMGSYSHFNSRLVRGAVEWEITGGGWCVRSYSHSNGGSQLRGRAFKH
jgi:hypothetical protein